MQVLETDTELYPEATWLFHHVYFQLSICIQAIKSLIAKLHKKTSFNQSLVLWFAFSVEEVISTKLLAMWYFETFFLRAHSLYNENESLRQRGIETPRCKNKLTTDICIVKNFQILDAGRINSRLHLKSRKMPMKTFLCCFNVYEGSWVCGLCSLVKQDIFKFVKFPASGCNFWSNLKTTMLRFFLDSYWELRGFTFSGST